MISVKRKIFSFLVSLSLPSILVMGFETHSVNSQVFRCNDTRLGEDKREELRSDNSRAGSQVVVGQDCSNANDNELLNEWSRRNAESENQRRQDSREHSDRVACQFYGVNSPNCTHEGLRRQAQQEQELKRQQQSRDIQKQQEINQENYFRQKLEIARRELRSTQESIIFWNDRPERRQEYEQKLPLAKLDVQNAERELHQYLNQR